LKIEQILPAPIITIIDYFIDHEKHSSRYNPKYLAWNIKVDDYNLSDKHYKEFRLDPKWDNRWDEYEERGCDIFSQICQGGLGFVGDKKTRDFDWTVYPGKEFDYTLWQSGRSGGWLILTMFEDKEMKNFDICDDLRDTYDIECDYTLSNLSDDTQDDYIGTGESAGVRGIIDRILDKYVTMYKFCKSLDEFNASEEYLYQLASHRQEKELEWKDRIEEIKNTRKKNRIDRDNRKFLLYLFPKEELCL